VLLGEAYVQSQAICAHVGGWRHSTPLCDHSNSPVEPDANALGRDGDEM
jgi:hypothetical protein